MIRHTGQEGAEKMQLPVRERGERDGEREERESVCVCVCVCVCL